MKRFRFIVWMVILCICFSACAPMSSVETPGPSEEQLRVHIIDVGQGDSSFIELPDGTTMLIDAGEREYGEHVVNYIRKLGYERIDYLVGTHPHSDHIGGLREVVETMQIGKIYMPKKASTTATFKNLLTAIKNKNLSIETAKAGKTIAKNGFFSVDILSPTSDDYGDEMNLYSAVIKITYGKKRFLFMGDAETENEEQLRGVTAEFIRVGHHGSDTSSGQEFVYRVGAQIAVVSVGKGNSYGLPKNKILQRWQDIGATIYRTDKSGSMVFESDGKSITLGSTVYTETAQNQEPNAETWVLNTSSKKVHLPDCSAVSKIKSDNKENTNESLAVLLKEGYTLCGICKPMEE